MVFSGEPNLRHSSSQLPVLRPLNSQGWLGATRQRSSCSHCQWTREHSTKSTRSYRYWVQSINMLEKVTLELPWLLYYNDNDPTKHKKSLSNSSLNKDSISTYFSLHPSNPLGLCWPRQWTPAMCSPKHLECGWSVLTVQWMKNIHNSEDLVWKKVKINFKWWYFGHVELTKNIIKIEIFI